MLRRIPGVTAVVLLVVTSSACSTTEVATAPPGPQPQLPSPMAESVRAHGRVEDRVHPGRADTIWTVLPAPAAVFVPEALAGAAEVDLLVHFHGAGYVVRDAAAQAGRETVAVSVNLGAGSSVYERPFMGTNAFSSLVDSVEAIVSPAVVRRVVLSSWSAGYGAVRAILRAYPGDIAGVILLDGLHTDYVPDGVRLADGGALNESKMIPFRVFAERAVRGETRMFVTHSEIFPGTYASTTETAEFLAASLGLKREPVLAWGPVGMQAISQTRAGRLVILGFAGNSAPDHVDHLHSLAAWVTLLMADGG